MIRHIVPPVVRVVEGERPPQDVSLFPEESALIRNALFARMRDPVVFFFHPWEFVDMTRAPIPLTVNVAQTSVMPGQKLSIDLTTDPAAQVSVTLTYPNGQQATIPVTLQRSSARVTSEVEARGVARREKFFRALRRVSRLDNIPNAVWAKAPERT